MIPKFPPYINQKLIEGFITDALEEDIGPGDYSSLACIDPQVEGRADLIVKEDGVLAGVWIAEQVFKTVDTKLNAEIFFYDASVVKAGDKVLTVFGSAQSILSAERLVLNILQRMSGIATKTARLNSLIKGSGTRLLDTRKTTPNFRAFEKWAVLLGGGVNHRFALYDRVMLKDNHNDYAGGITRAVDKTRKYLDKHNLKLKIEVETRNLAEVQQAVDANVDIILLDNMDTCTIQKALQIIDKKVVSEASGGITESNIREIADTGVDYISVGALTHSYKSLDMSLKAVIKQKRK